MGRDSMYIKLKDTSEFPLLMVMTFTNIQFRYERNQCLIYGMDVLPKL